MKIALRIDPRLLDNPDLDIRYVLPDLIEAQSKGSVRDEGYDYVGGAPFLVLFLAADDADSSIAHVRDVIDNHQVLGNNLRAAVVMAVEHEGAYEVVYPAEFVGSFLSESVR